MFDTAETIYQAAPGTTPAERATVLHGRPADAAAMVAAGSKPVSTGIEVRAFVNNSRWLVSCPDPTCGGCQYASKTDPRFFCNYCHNAAAGGGWVDVAWPADDELTAIEAALSARPDPRTRNWTTETVAELLAENEENA